MAKRHKFTAQFKAKFVLEALRGDKTIQEIAAKYQVHRKRCLRAKSSQLDGLKFQASRSSILLTG